MKVRRFARLCLAQGWRTGVLAGVLVLVPNAFGHEGHDLGLKVQVPLLMSPGAQSGETLYDAKCVTCHGKNAEGTHSGPSLIPYDSRHHPDADFVNAIRLGVEEHHWNFGDMPPIADVSDDEIDDLISYIRELQAFNSDSHHHNKTNH